mmetsp:Transcript_130322/g.259955  ORF Transcript_130322/g.259955 Transcript_130322/m.259955 type:complete len:217 (-) Transcript_130322:685-1335(-)
MRLPRQLLRRQACTCASQPSIQCQGLRPYVVPSMCLCAQQLEGHSGCLFGKVCGRRCPTAPDVKDNSSVAWRKMLLQREANANVLAVSSVCRSAGEIAASTRVYPLPQRDSISTLVSLELRKTTLTGAGTGAVAEPPVAGPALGQPLNAATQLESIISDLLWCDMARCCTTCALLSRSEPARSAKISRPPLPGLSPTSDNSIVKTKCPREDSLLMA